MSPSELRLQIADTRRNLDALQASLDRGDVPEVSDARLVRSNAEWLEKMVIRANVDAVRATPERTAAEDKAAQVYVETKGRA